MNYEKLFGKGLIKPFKAEPSQIKSRLDLAARDLKTAKQILDQSSDWSYNITYNALLQASRALMFAEGYRPTSGEGQHRVTILFAEVALGEGFDSEIRFFDKMRVKRNRAVYDTAGIVSESEARQAIEFAEKLIEKIREMVE
ncbi:MAG: HEPN domain-containing protein [Syntrophales bacterium]|nr:HEPN domain-containing protein [Syntrophales bacterium]